jgi:hypothetical protein
MRALPRKVIATESISVRELARAINMLIDHAEANQIVGTPSMIVVRRGPHGTELRSIGGDGTGGDDRDAVYS